MMLKCHLLCIPCKVCLVILLVALLTLSPGCGKQAEPMPKTYPVSGKLVASKGKLPPAGSVIRFTPADNELVAGGRIEADGSFTLSILYKGKILPGATQGPHQVTILPPISDEPTETIALKEPYTVKPEPNQFHIDLSAR